MQATDPPGMKSGAVDRKTVLRIVKRGEEEGALERHKLQMPAKTIAGLRQHEVLTAAGNLNLELLEKVHLSRAYSSGTLSPIPYTLPDASVVAPLAINVAMLQKSDVITSFC